MPHTTDLAFRFWDDLLSRPAGPLAFRFILQPGQSQTMRFVLHPSDLASFDEKTSSWLAEAGTYTVSIGASSTNIKLSQPFTLAKNRVAYPLRLLQRVG